MKMNFLFIAVLFFCLKTFGQVERQIVFDTSTNNQEFKFINRIKYYSQTDFSFIDTLKLWRYKFDATHTGLKGDSIKAIGQIIFERIKPIDDKLNYRLYNKHWTPNITFEIYKLSDSEFCYSQSNWARVISSCIAPEVGGDMIILDKFIFLNRDVCVSCTRNDTKMDYCRPVINYVFSKIDRTKITTIESILKQFIIKRE